MTDLLVVPPAAPLVVFTGVAEFRAAWRYGKPGPIPTLAVDADSDTSRRGVVESASSGVVGPVDRHVGEVVAVTPSAPARGLARPTTPTTKQGAGADTPTPLAAAR